MIAAAKSSLPHAEVPFPLDYPPPYKLHRQSCGVALYQSMGIAQRRHGRTLCGVAAQLRASSTRRTSRSSRAIAGSGRTRTSTSACGWVTCWLRAPSARIDTCPMASVAAYPDTLRAHLPIAETDVMLFGLALGHADPTRRRTGHGPHASPSTPTSRSARDTMLRPSMKSRVLVVIWVALCALARAGARPERRRDEEGAGGVRRGADRVSPGQVRRGGGGLSRAHTPRGRSRSSSTTSRASYHMKGKKTSDPVAYGKAVEFYKRTSHEEPDATDKAKVEKAIGVLEAEIQRLKDASPAAGGRAPARRRGRCDAVARGPAARRRQGPRPRRDRDRAAERDDLSRRQEEGPVRDHAVVGLARRRAQDDHREARLQGRRDHDLRRPDQARAVSCRRCRRRTTSAWIEIASNVPKLGRVHRRQERSARSVRRRCRRRSSRASTRSGSRRGLRRVHRDVDIAPGETTRSRRTLKGSPVGKLDVVGLGHRRTRRSSSTARCCASAGRACASVPEGDRTRLRCTRPGFKPYTRRITIEAKTETSIKVALVPEPSRSDAVVAYVLAGVFLGGAIFVGSQANDLHDQLAEGDRRAAIRRSTPTTRGSCEARSTRSPPMARSRVAAIPPRPRSTTRSATRVRRRRR